jgi:hypothetical protein
MKYVTIQRMDEAPAVTLSIGRGFDTLSASSPHIQTAKQTEPYPCLAGAEHFTRF